MRMVLILTFLLATSLAWGQMQPVKTDVQPGRSRNTTSIRIDQSRVYVNGKLVPAESLPQSLKVIDPYIYYESTIAGVSEFTFNLGENYYLVSNGKLSEVTPAPAENYDSKTATEAYYSQLKRESPGLFYGLSREGALLEQVRLLLNDYSLARGQQREKIKEEIRLVLGQLYDINERNKELEIAELEDMLEAAKKEVQYRKTHKSEIIQNSLDNLLRE